MFAFFGFYRKLDRSAWPVNGISELQLENLENRFASSKVLTKVLAGLQLTCSGFWTG